MAGNKWGLVFHNESLQGGQVFVVVQRGAGRLEILGPRHFAESPCSCQGARKSHTKVDFIETGGANKAPLLQGADSQHKFPFTPTVHELTLRGGLKEDFLLSI